MGTVVRLWRYPVKSMLGEPCEHVDVNTRGVEGDRLYAVHDANGKFGSGKSSRRFCKIDGLFRFHATYQGETPTIRFPDGRVMAGNAPGIDGALAVALGQPVTLAREAAVSHLDAGPIHLLTTASVAWLRAVLPGALVDERRFRPNVVIDVPGETQVERGWLGKTLAVGDEVRVRVMNLTKRCVMVGLAQADLPDDGRVLQRLADDADVCFGVYADILVPGRIRRGDSVSTLD
jgi:MOSC domain-containing protein